MRHNAPGDHGTTIPRTLGIQEVSTGSGQHRTTMIVYVHIRSRKELDERYGAALQTLSEGTCLEERHCGGPQRYIGVGSGQRGFGNRDTVRVSRLGQREMVERYLLPTAVPVV